MVEQDVARDERVPDLVRDDARAHVDAPALEVVARHEDGPVRRGPSPVGLGLLDANGRVVAEPRREEAKLADSVRHEATSSGARSARSPRRTGLSGSDSDGSTASQTGGSTTAAASASLRSASNWSREVAREK
jgi:hypothetical protein